MDRSAQPRFKLPLSILNDPAFSPDPRQHPHFPLTHANSYKELPHAAHTPTSRARVPPRNRKGRMRDLVRRLTTRHSLDRIDELDETDPFGGSYHHGGPYEAIASNLVQPTPSSKPDSRRSKRQSDPLPSRPGQRQPASRVPSTIGGAGLSLHLQPGQILQQNAVYTSYASHAALVHNPHEPKTRPIVSQPNPPSLSLQSPRMPVSENYSSLRSFQNQPLPSSSVPQKQYSGNMAPHSYNNLSPRRLSAALDAPYRIETTIYPPPRYESSFYSAGPPQPPQLPSFNSTSQKAQLTESPVSVLQPHASGHQGPYSMDVSYALNNAITQSSEPLRTRHLPKRLVMPALLQPQQSQPQSKSPSVETTAWQDECHALEDARFEGHPAMYTQKPRLLRKKSSVLSAKTPIPGHVPTSRGDTTPIRGNSLAKTTNEAQGTKERTRRRLSKRKDDI